MNTVEHEHQQSGGSVHYRLDLVRNPFAPTSAVQAAIAHDDPDGRASSVLIDELMMRLADRAGVPLDWIVLANGIDELYRMIMRWRADCGPTLIYPPMDVGLERLIETSGAQVERAPRRSGFRLPIDVGSIQPPNDATTIVMSPNDPDGSVISVQNLVRLSRLSSLVVIDERHAAYSSISVAPLVREWDNVVIVQTFETFAGLTDYPLAWAIAPSRHASQIAAQAEGDGIERLAVVGALASLSDEDGRNDSVRQAIAEKGRLFRQLRKLNMVSVPYPSWSNFLLMRVERGDARAVADELLRRGIAVYRPPQPNLRQHLRVTGVSADATLALKRALIEIGLELGQASD